MGTVYENAVGTAQALAQLKANIDEPFIRFGERMRGAKPADLNVIPKALGKAKDWSPLQYEKGYTVNDKEWGQVTHKPITEAFEKFKTGPSLKDVTGDITKAPQWLAQGVGKMGPQFGAAGAATALTGPFGGILMNAVNNIGERYNTALKEKVNAPAAGIFTGLLISAFDTLGPWLQLRGITKGLLSTAGVGGGTELVQEIMAILHEKFLGIPVKDPFWRLMENFLLGMFIEGGTHAAARPSKAAAQPQVSTEAPPPPPPPGGPPPPPPGAPTMVQMRAKTPATTAAPQTQAPLPGAPGYSEWLAQQGIRLDEKGGIDFTAEPPTGAPPAPAPAAQPAAASPRQIAKYLETLSQQRYGKSWEDLNDTDGVKANALWKEVNSPGFVPPQSSVDVQPPQPAAPASPVDAESERISQSLFGRPYADLDPETARLVRLDAIENLAPTTTVPDADMMVEGPNGPQAVRSEDVFVDRTLQAAGIEEPKLAPSAWEAKVAASREYLAKRGSTLSSNPFADVEWIGHMAVVIADDIRAGAIKLGNAIEHIVAKFGPEARVVAPQVFAQAQELAKEEQASAQGMPSAAPQTAPGASVSQAEADRGGKALLDMKSQGAPGMILEGGTQYSTGPGRERSVVVRDSKGQPIAVLGFYAADSGVGPAPPSHEAYPTVYVAPEHRRKGIAKRMYEFAKQQGYDLSQLSGRETSPMGEALVGSLRQTGVLGPQTAPEAPAAAQPSVTATQPTGASTGQPAPVTPPPVEPPLGAMPDATDPEQPPASAFSTAVKTFGRYNRRMLQLRQAAWRHPNFAPLQAMVQAMDRMNKAIFQWKDRGGDVSAAWRALGPARAQILNDFSLAATQWSDKLGRKLTPEERVRLGDHHGVDEDILEVYDQQQQYFQDSWDAMRQAYITELQAEITNPETLAAATAEINAQFDEKMRHNYFPLQRFGRWMVTGWEIGPDGKEFVGQHEHYVSERAAKIAKRDMERRYREAGTRISRVTHTENNPETRDLGGLPPGMADRIAKDLNLDEKQRKELDRAIDNVKAASVTQRSALRHLLRRKGTKGFSRDAQRAFEAYVTWAANHIGKTQERANLKQAVRDAEKARNNVGAYSGQAVNPMPLTRLHALMKDSLDNMLNPRVQSNSFMGSAASWFLGFGPIQIAQNFIQSGNTPFVLAKEMGADGKPIGLPEAIKQWAKAMKDVSQVYSKRWYDKKTDPTPGNQYDYRGPISDEEWALMEEGRKEGLTGDTNANQASGNAKQSTFEYLFTWPFGHDPFGQESKGRDMGRKGRAWDDWINGFGRFSLKGHQWSEEWTRRVGLLAAARAFKNRGNAAPYQAARDVVLKVQGSHEPSNRSWLQQKAPAALVFKSFLLNNIWLTHQTKAGRMLWLAQLVLGGARGVLGASHIFLLLSLLGSFGRKFFGYKDPYVDVEHTIREMITERMGPRAARVALHGVSGGIAGAPDLSNSFNFGEPIPGLNPTMRWLGGRDDTKTWFWNMGQAAGGAVGGTAMNLSKALVEEGPESENFLRLAMPRWLGNILKAQQAWREERYATTKGTGLAKIDRNNPIHMLELAGYAAGMTPERLAEVREAMNSTQEMERYYTKLMDDARQEYYEAQRSHDADAIRNASDYVQFVKSILPEGMSNKLNRMQQGFGQAERRREQRDRGIPNDRSLRRAREDWLTPYQLEPR